MAADQLPPDPLALAARAVAEVEDDWRHTFRTFDAAVIKEVDVEVHNVVPGVWMVWARPTLTWSLAAQVHATREGVAA